MDFDFKNIRVISMDYDSTQYPEFEDSAIVEAEYKDTGKDLTEEEVEYINWHHPDFVYDCLQSYIY